ncbi:MAG TPA: hypothetical protein VJG90_04570 [Candidatus Nanoarchaeia archaeon]|nr:hypothetical protein [Candidatus Nanoarchaeia archaeon]
MEKRQIVSGKESLEVVTDSKKVLEVIDESLYLRHIIPELESRFINDSSKIGSTVELLNGDPEYTCVSDLVRVKAAYEHVSEGQICYLIYHLLQREFLKHESYVVHGAAIAKNNKSILLIGASKAGKTSLSLELSLNRGFTLYGDDAIKLSLADKVNLSVVSGNRFVGYRKHHTRHNKISEAYPDGLPVYLDAVRLGIYSKTPSALNHVVFLEQDLFGTNRSSYLGAEVGRILFYEMISREMRAAGYCIMENALPLPSLDNGKESKFFLEVLKRQDVRFTTLTGNYRDMLKRLEEITND